MVHGKTMTQSFRQSPMAATLVVPSRGLVVASWLMAILSMAAATTTTTHSVNVNQHALLQIHVRVQLVPDGSTEVSRPPETSDRQWIVSMDEVSPSSTLDGANPGKSDAAVSRHVKDRDGKPSHSMVQSEQIMTLQWSQQMLNKYRSKGSVQWEGVASRNVLFPILPSSTHDDPMAENPLSLDRLDPRGHFRTLLVALWVQDQNQGRELLARQLASVPRTIQSLEQQQQVYTQVHLNASTVWMVKPASSSADGTPVKSSFLSLKPTVTKETAHQYEEFGHNPSRLTWCKLTCGAAVLSAVLFASIFAVPSIAAALLALIEHVEGRYVDLYHEDQAQEQEEEEDHYDEASNGLPEEESDHHEEASESVCESNDDSAAALLALIDHYFGDSEDEDGQADHELSPAPEEIVGAIHESTNAEERGQEKRPTSTATCDHAQAQSNETSRDQADDDLVIQPQQPCLNEVRGAAPSAEVEHQEAGGTNVGSVSLVVASDIKFSAKGSLRTGSCHDVDGKPSGGATRVGLTRNTLLRHQSHPFFEPLSYLPRRAPRASITNGVQAEAQVAPAKGGAAQASYDHASEVVKRSSIPAENDQECARSDEDESVTLNEPSPVPPPDTEVDIEREDRHRTTDGDDSLPLPPSVTRRKVQQSPGVSFADAIAAMDRDFRNSQPPRFLIVPTRPGVSTETAGAPSSEAEKDGSSTCLRQVNHKSSGMLLDSTALHKTSGLGDKGGEESHLCNVQTQNPRVFAKKYAVEDSNASRSISDLTPVCEPGGQKSSKRLVTRSSPKQTRPNLEAAKSILTNGAPRSDAPFLSPKRLLFNMKRRRSLKSEPAPPEKNLPMLDQKPGTQTTGVVDEFVGASTSDATIDHPKSTKTTESLHSRQRSNSSSEKTRSESSMSIEQNLDSDCKQNCSTSGKSSPEMTLVFENTSTASLPAELIECVANRGKKRSRDDFDPVLLDGDAIDVQEQESQKFNRPDKWSKKKDMKSDLQELGSEKAAAYGSTPAAESGPIGPSPDSTYVSTLPPHSDCSNDRPDLGRFRRHDETGDPQVAEDSTKLPGDTDKMDLKKHVVLNSLGNPKTQSSPSLAMVKTDANENLKQGDVTQEYLGDGTESQPFELKDDTKEGHGDVLPDVGSSKSLNLAAEALRAPVWEYGTDRPGILPNETSPLVAPPKPMTRSSRRNPLSRKVRDGRLLVQDSSANQGDEQPRSGPEELSTARHDEADGTAASETEANAPEPVVSASLCAAAKALTGSSSWTFASADGPSADVTTVKIPAGASMGGSHRKSAFHLENNSHAYQTGGETSPLSENRRRGIAKSVAGAISKPLSGENWNIQQRPTKKRAASHRLDDGPSKRTRNHFGETIYDEDLNSAPNSELTISPSRDGSGILDVWGINDKIKVATRKGHFGKAKLQSIAEIKRS